MPSENIETLQADLELCKKQMDDDTGALASVQNIARHLKQTLYPLLDAIVGNLVEMDGVVEDMLSDADDILQPESSEVFAEAFQGAAVIGKLLNERLSPTFQETDVSRAKALAILQRFSATLQEAENLRVAITVQI